MRVRARPSLVERGARGRSAVSSAPVAVVAQLVVRIPPGRTQVPAVGAPGVAGEST